MNETMFSPQTTEPLVIPPVGAGMGSGDPSMSQLTDRQLLEAAYKESRRAAQFLKWQLIITVALVIIPLLITMAAIPFLLNQVRNIYSIGGVL